MCVEELDVALKMDSEKVLVVVNDADVNNSDLSGDNATSHVPG